VIGAATAATFGRTVALINDHHEPGGAGINTGTSPSKTLRETALALSGLQARKLYGVRKATKTGYLGCSTSESKWA
jgi:NAD(P) transhydrogenase